MIKFINEMRAYATNSNPDFLIIQQNEASLCSGHPELFSVIDAIAQEGIWFEGKATDNWDDREGYDIINSSDTINYYLNYLNKYKDAGLPAFDCEYALFKAQDGYSNSYSKGYIPSPGYSVDTNNVIVLKGGFTKYKDKKKVDVLKLIDVTPDELEKKFQNNGAIRILDGDTFEVFYWPRKPESKRGSRVWKYKKKKEGIIKYVPKKDKLIIKLWQQMPTNRIIYVRLYGKS